MQNVDLSYFHTEYLVVTSFAVVGGVAGVAFRLWMAREVMRERGGTASKHRASVVDVAQVTTSSNALSRGKAAREARLKAIKRDVVMAAVGLGVFAVEDFP